jgi:hypothetical protein
MNDVDPQAYLADILAKIANRHPMSKLDELLPWAYDKTNAGQRTSLTVELHDPVTVPTAAYRSRDGTAGDRPPSLTPLAAAH